MQQGMNGDGYWSRSLSNPAGESASGEGQSHSKGLCGDGGEALKQP